MSVSPLCQLCESTMSALSDACDERQLWQCPTCGMMQAEREETTGPSLTFQQRDETQKLADSILSRVGNILPRGTRQPRMLHIHCQLGQMLCVAKKRGWRAVGVDPRRKAVELCRARGLDVFHAGAERLPFESSSFQFVCADHVIDRTENAGRALKEWKRVLRPGGLLFLSAKNCDANAHGESSDQAWLPGQRYGFGVENLVRLAERSGLESLPVSKTTETGWGGLLHTLQGSLGFANRWTSKSSMNLELEILMLKPAASSQSAGSGKRTSFRAA
jgi:SAM-dependent methyltransferase